MPSSVSEARSRVAILALVTLPLWACATAIDSNPSGLSSLATNGGDRDPSQGGGDSANGGSDVSAASASAIAGTNSAAGGATGAAGNGASGAPAQSGGAPNTSAGSPGKGGASSTAGAGSAGSASGGKGGASTGAGGTGAGGAGKGGTGSAGASSAGASPAGGAGASAGAASAGGPSVGGGSAGGPTGSTTCDAAHAVATIPGGGIYTGKANDCVRLTVNPSWSVIGVKLQPMPETAVYPVPFSFFSCGGNGTGALTGTYVDANIKSGANPGCDFFVQFEGGSTTIKVTYYD